MAINSKIADIQYKRPDGNYHIIQRRKLLEKITSSDKRTDLLFNQWTKLRDAWESSCILTTIGFSIDYSNEFWIQESEYLNSMTSEISKMESHITNAFLKRGRVGELRKFIGDLAIDRLKSSVLSDEKVALELAESRSIQEWVNYQYSFQMKVNNKKQTLGDMYNMLNSKNRVERKKAYTIINEYYSSSNLDYVLNRLIHLRDEISKSCNYENYEDYYENEFYRDWGSEQAEVFKESIKKYIVPIVHSFQKKKKKNLGFTKLENYDEGIFWKSGNPKLNIHKNNIVNKNKEFVSNIFGDVGYDLFENMDKRKLLDVLPRKNKERGACCWLIDGTNDPYIMASLSGNPDDPETLFHEFGHALQFHLSGDNPIIELRKATRELVEIPSISSELFLHDSFDVLYGKSHRNRVFVHLIYLLILVCKVCILDEWQREIYRNPNLTTKERNLKWAESEKKWMPWRVPNPERWKQDGTIFENPFYDLDYAIAIICSLELWFEYKDDKKIATDKFFELCNIGGSKNFTGAIKKVNIKNPFLPETVKEISKKLETLLSEYYS